MMTSYQKLAKDGRLAERASRAWTVLENCALCAHECHVDRRFGVPAGARCQSGNRASVASFGAHHGEEAVLSGTQGSGTIFFAGCNLRCLYCQNWDISWQGNGRPVDTEDLASMMLDLQAMGCHNVNLVSPSHVVPQILSALVVAAERGLSIPLVYNTAGYERIETLALLDGVIDIYMPDMKYANEREARALSKAPSYPAINRAAVSEMHRQVGDLALDKDGLAWRGLLVRHLVLPDGRAGTDDILRFVAEEISPHTYVNLMDQYRPCHHADRLPVLQRPITAREYAAALAAAKRLGLTRLDGARASPEIRSDI